MLVLHANWSHKAIHFWAESLDRFGDVGRDLAALPASGDEDDAAAPVAVAATAAVTRSVDSVTDHPYVADAAVLESLLLGLDLVTIEDDDEDDDDDDDTPRSVMDPLYTTSSIELRLPFAGSIPMPSDRLAAAAGTVDLTLEPTLYRTEIDSVRVSNARALRALLALEDHGPTEDLVFSHDLRFWIAVARFVIELLADQRFVPTMIRRRNDGVRAAWYPWLHDDQFRDRIGGLMHAMPPIVRAVDDGNDGQPWPILNDALATLTDASVRSALTAEDYIEAIEDRDADADPHVAWLGGLLDWDDQVPVSDHHSTDLIREVASWIGRLDTGQRDQSQRLCLVLSEPLDMGDSAEPVWDLSLHLQSTDEDEQLISAEMLWSQDAAQDGMVSVDGPGPQELMLAELSRAARLYPKLEEALAGVSPQALELSTVEAYAFLREFRPLLEESEVGVIVPEWFDQPAGRLNARLHIEPLEDERPPSAAGAVSPSAQSLLGLNNLVHYQWKVAVGDEALPLEEFERLSRETVPLVRVHGRWVEIRPDDMAEALSFLKENQDGQISLREAVRLAYGAGDASNRPALPVVGVDAEGWIGDLFHASVDATRMPMIEQPGNFHGELRPYQLSGVSWLAFLDQFGLGACLADDMGLGKTIQLIAMMLWERNTFGEENIGPTLLVVPTSLIANWTREVERFAPNLQVMVQHGPDRPTEEEFAEKARAHDLVVTTYGLVSRDVDSLNLVEWHRVVLDEAQYIKNPPTKQTAAIRSLNTERRIALTGTPLENRLTELWSIMEFCNPGYLGTSGDFRRRFAVPIERHRDERQADRLRGIVQPFILRRLKTDPKVISDLPDCQETKEYSTLTSEQAALYENQVRTMMSEVDRAEGMQRRGLVLATLIKLKQICNHPAQFLNEQADANKAMKSSGADTPRLWQPNRSGKCKRLLQMLEEVVASDNKALVFTQFRQMGHLLTAMISHHLDREVLFLHGGTTPKKRQQLIDRFQSDDSRAPIFVLSLKAGGVGLNLTAANHVFHFDRWWNPAVEKQATDRAFRIGQTKTVQVHKFVCVGTLEEHIDQLIEQKTELAENIIGSGEQWLTELSGNQLRDMLKLRESAVERDG